MVSTLAVEWIEIEINGQGWDGAIVSTLAVEWIEIEINGQGWDGAICVSTLAVEWIEIFKAKRLDNGEWGLHPRGGVD